MNKLISLLLTLSSFLMGSFFNGAVAQNCPNNLLTNPGFESGLTGWNADGGNVTISTAAHSGTKAAKIGGTGYGSVGFILPTTPGTAYTAKAWAKYTGSSNRAVQLRFLNASWVTLPGAASQQISATSYTEYTLTGTAPAGAAYVYVIASKDGNGSIEVDDFCLTTGGGSGPCSITVNSAGISCDDNGTPTNPGDDLFYVNLLVNGSFTGNSGWTTDVNGLTVSGSYGVPGQVGPFPVSNGMVSFFVQDIDEPSCNGQVSVPPPTPCSSTGPADLAVTSVACPANYPNWTQPFTWNVNVKNNGSSASLASPIYLYNYAPQAMGYASQLLGSATVPALSPGQTASVAITSQPSAHSAIPGDASYGEDFLLTGTKGLSFTQIGFGNPPAYTEADGFPNIYCKKFNTDIVVDMSSTMTTVAPTQPVVYTVKVTNNGPVDAYNISSSLFASNSGTPFPGGITAQLSTGLIWDVYTPGGAGTTNTGRIWYIPFLAAGQSATATVTQDPGGNSPWPSSGFTISKTADSGHNMDTNPANNSGQVSFNSGGGGQVDLSLNITSASQLAPFSNVSFQVVAQNSGPATVTDIDIQVTKPNNVVYVGGNEYSVTAGTFLPSDLGTWGISSLAAGESAVLTVNFFTLTSNNVTLYARTSGAVGDDVDSTPGNGSCCIPTEDDEATYTLVGGGPTGQPDLTILDLQIPTPSVAAGAILSYNFDASNAGTAAVPGNFTIKSYISTDQTLSGNDIQDGTIQSGNYAAGFSVQNVAGASTIPANLAAGPYFLIVKIDGDNAIAEGNENNNVVVKPFTVTGGGQDDCEQILSPSEMICASQLPSGNMQVAFASSSSLLSYQRSEYSSEGDLLGTLPDVPKPSVNVTVENGQVVERNASTGATISQKSIPATLVTQYDPMVACKQTSTGHYFLAGFANGAGNILLVDGGINLVSANATNAPLPKAIQPTSWGGAVLATSAGSTFPQGTLGGKILGISANSAVLNSTQVIYDPTGIIPLPCGSDGFRISGFRGYGHAGVSGNFDFEDDYQFTPQNTTQLRFRQSGWSNISPLPIVEETIHTFPNADGTKWVVIRRQQAAAPQYNVVGADTMFYEKRDASDQLLLAEPLDKTVFEGQVYEVAEVAAGQLAFFGLKNGQAWYYNPFCGGTPPPTGCGAVSITSDAGSITIAGASAPHVLIKVFKPNWTLAFECLDNCGDPLVVDGLSAGNHHVQVKLIDNGWGEICYLEQTVNVSNFTGGNGGNALVFENSRQRLAFDKIYPNPAKYFVTLEVYSKDDQPATLDFYDQMGRSVQRLEVDLKRGRNEVQVPVFDWKSGAYNVIARGEGLPAYGRFLKVWEE